MRRHSLSELMREYLELLHHTESTSDELILHRYPPTLRKKAYPITYGGHIGASVDSMEVSDEGLLLPGKACCNTESSLDRHLYLDIFRKCPPFKGCKTRFLDEVISMARMEVFNPEVSHFGGQLHAFMAVGMRFWGAPTQASSTAALQRTAAFQHRLPALQHCSTQQHFNTSFQHCSNSYATNACTHHSAKVPACATFQISIV
eukprot:scaffold47598_cov25-Tisochrysis_lutea.AAC.1